MALPQQVQAALDAAEATLAQANTQQGQPTETPPPQSDAPPTAPVQQAQPQPPVVPDAPKPAPSADDKTWEARYKTLQGVFNKEVPTLQAQVKELRSELAVAIERLNEASKQQEQRQPEPQQAVDPKDVDAFGADLVDMVSRVVGGAIQRATQVFDGRIGSLEGKLSQFQATLAGTTQQVALTAEQQFFKRVDELVPGWEQINTDPSFLAWLNDVDPVYQVPRYVALQNAQKAFNADHAAAVFRAYLGPTKKDTPKGPDPLDKQVNPTGAATTAPPVSEPKILSQAFITKYYRDVAQGVYRGREQEAAQIEQSINAALAEGRVR